MMMPTTGGLLCNFSFKLRSSCPTPSLFSRKLSNQGFNNERATSIIMGCFVGHQLRRSSSSLVMCKAQKEAKQQQPGLKDEEKRGGHVQQLLLWALEGAYVSWLFFLPYAPGDPVWAIKTQTVNDLVDLSLNFFFILPLVNGVGIRVIDAPVLHPVAEGLFNFVIGWTFMFAPLIFTDCRRDRYKGSLEILWTLQMFLTNTLLIPYMAIRLDDVDVTNAPKKPSKFASTMMKGAPFVGLVGGAACLVSALWALFGRGDGGFGALADRWEFFARYIGSERLAYAFIWDICLYIIFQPWLIGDNLQNVEENRVGIVSKLRFIPVIGLLAFLLNLRYEAEF